jgi:hypothetical protein
MKITGIKHTIYRTNVVYEVYLNKDKGVTENDG